jgi:uncharacterized C2H2 Zn-finger protein
VSNHPNIIPEAIERCEACGAMFRDAESLIAHAMEKHFGASQEEEPPK